MASDAGPKAPPGTPAPTGAEDVQEVKVGDGYVYVVKGVRPSAESYVTYSRDAPRADWFEFSQSGYPDYGNAAVGTYCDADGNVVMPDGSRNPAPPPARLRHGQHRPLPLPLRRPLADDRAQQVSPDGGRSYGPDLIDRWKARAFAQDPSSKTPCCGFEEEDTPLGRLEHAARRAARAGARDPRDVGRRLRHERDPPRDLLPRHARAEDLAARAPDPAARRHLRPVGLQRGARSRATSTRATPRRACRSTAATTRRSATSTTPATRPMTRTTPAQLDAGLPQLLQRDAAVRLRARSTRSSTTSSATTSRSTSFDPTFSQANVALEWNQVAGPNGTIVDRYRTDTGGPDAGRRRAVGGRRAVLPRRLVLRRRHRQRSGPARAAGLGRRAARGSQVLAPRGRRSPTARRASSRARSPRTACTCSSSPTPTTRG